MKKPRYDVLVAGAGPAGCATALACVRRGLSVLLLDRAPFPRDKICGDVLLPESRQALEQLGIDSQLLKPQAHRITGCRYHVTNDLLVEAPFCDLSGHQRPWWVVRRRDFDAFLLEQVRLAGVEIQQHQVVDVAVEHGAVSGVVVIDTERNRRHLEARAVVAADGASSVIARRFGLYERSPQHLCLALRGYVKIEQSEPNIFSVFTNEKTLPGCAWIVPLGDGWANVGIGMLRQDLLRHGETLQQLLAEVRLQYPQLEAIDLEQVSWRGWSLPGASQPVKRYSAGLMLVGDAGNMVDPFTGHGIHTALVGGLCAAEILQRAHQQDNFSADMFRHFDLLWRQRFSNEMALGRFLQRVCASPWRVAALIRYVKTSQKRRGLFGGLVGHAFPRTSLLRPTALARALF